MAAKTNQQMKGTPEVDSNGVTPKSQRGQVRAKKAQLGQVRNVHDKRGRNWLRVFVSGVLVTDMVGWLTGIYTAGWSQEMTINAMWMAGVAHVAALAVINFMHKLE